LLTLHQITKKATFSETTKTITSMKKSTILVAALACLALCLSSCVSKKTYEGLQSDYASLQNEYNSLQQKYQSSQIDLAKSQTSGKSIEDRLNDAQKQNAELRQQYAELQRSLDNSLNQNTQGNVNISKLVDEINASNAFIKHLVEAKSKSDSLNQALSNKLTRSLTRDEMKEVDVQVLKGVVYISLADNMLYKSGSYEINDRASETLSKIAKIITDYKDYEVLIEGNTDNVPISRTNIRNNWDLSALRASSVVQALQNTYGVEPKRLSAAGRGEYNPIATNNTEIGRQRNRRTQIIITPKLDQFMELIDEAPETK
jgi:chemotaxis protein MotB